MCEPAGEIPLDPDFARGVRLELEGGVVLPTSTLGANQTASVLLPGHLKGFALGDERVVVALRAADRPRRGLRLGGHSQ